MLSAGSLREAGKRDLYIKTDSTEETIHSSFDSRMKAFKFNIEEDFVHNLDFLCLYFPSSSFAIVPRCMDT